MQIGQRFYGVASVLALLLVVPSAPVHADGTTDVYSINDDGTYSPTATYLVDHDEAIAAYELSPAFRDEGVGTLYSTMPDGTRVRIGTGAGFIQFLEDNYARVGGVASNQACDAQVEIDWTFFCLGPCVPDSFDCSLYLKAEALITCNNAPPCPPTGKTLCADFPDRIASIRVIGPPPPADSVCLCDADDVCQVQDGFKVDQFTTFGPICECIECRIDADCDDGNKCTSDSCDPATGLCRHDPILFCCTSQADCLGECQDCQNNVCVDNQMKCMGCEACVDGVCVDNQDKCFGCEDCLNAVCVDRQAKCPLAPPLGCQTCAGGICVDNQAKCFGCEACAGGVCVDDDSKCPVCEFCGNGTCEPIAGCDPKSCEGKGTTCGDPGDDCICETRVDGTLNCADAADFFDLNRHGTCPNGDADCPTGTKCFVNAAVPVCAHNCGEHEEFENWVIADDFCIGCQCDCDLNQDGVCDLKDVSRFAVCFFDSTLPGCDSSDLNCDGDVDVDDFPIMACLFGDGTDCCPEGSRGIDRVRWWGSYLDQCPGCKCDVTKEEPPLCNTVDLEFVADCIINPGDPGCDNTDVNCDGVIDALDVDVVTCLLQGNPEDKCCTPVVDSWLIALHRDIPPKACPPAPTGTFPVDLCGTISRCAIGQLGFVNVFQPNGSAVTYELQGSIATFADGDELRLCGHIVPNVPRRCPSAIDLIVVDAVSECETKHSRPSRLVAQWVFPDDVVTRVQTGKAGWDGHPIYSYTVDLPDGCLEHNFFHDGEYDPATGVFFPRPNLTYWISIQAAVGHTVEFDDVAQEWIEVNTGRTVDQEFWGWHTTPHGYQHKDDAYMGRLTMSCDDPMRWKYDWMSPLHCSDPQFRDCCDDPTKSIDMAFYLIRTKRVCLGGLLAGQPCTVDADCKVDGTSGATCFAREEIKWCQPVNPLRGTSVPTPIPTPGGIDEFPDTSVEVVINIPGLTGARTVVLTGRTVIARTSITSDPGSGIVQPGAVAGDVFGDVSLDDLGRLRSRARKVNPVNRSLIRDVFTANTSPSLSTEILSMDLSGFDEGGLGNVRLIVSNIGSSGQDGVRRQSHGEIRVTPLGSSGQDGVRHHAAFDVFFEIEVGNTAAGPGLAYVSDGPLRIEADLFEIPPTVVWFQSVGGVGLLDRDTLQPIPNASIKSVTHCVPTQPKGGVNIHSDVDWKTAPTVDCCEPDDSTLTGCTPSVCPNADEECRPVAGFTDAQGNSIITACDCVTIDPEGCHWEDLGAGEVDCVGDCPDLTACEITTVVNPDDGTIDTICGCDKIEKQACCLFDGTCIEVTTGDECCDLGGTPQGPGTDCLNTICPLPWPIVAGANWDIHMDIPGELANDFHIEGIVKSECPPVLVTHIDDLFPNFTHTFNPLGGGHYEFQADWSGADYQLCEILHLGLLFEVCCKNVMIDLVGWWTFDGVRIGGVVSGGVAAASNDGYWPFIGFDVQDCLPPPPEPPTCEQQVRFRNDSDRGTGIPVKILEMQLVSVDPSGLPPFDELCHEKPDGSPCGQHELPWVNVVDINGNIISGKNPISMAPGDEITVLLDNGSGTTAGNNVIHQFGLETPIDLKPAEFLLVRGKMKFIGNSGQSVAGEPVGTELRWFFDIHGAHHLPEPEACCFDDGTPCQNLIRQECLCAGGTPQGLGTNCSQPGICQDVCEPTTDKTSCTKVECPDLATDLKLCQTKCVVFNPLTGTSEVSECDCIGFDDCHVKVPPAGSTGGVAGGPGGNPCVVPDNGGTVELPPQGCEYLSPEEVHEILGGLPTGTTIEFAAIHKDFICGERNLGGDCPPPGICEDLAAGVDCFDSVVEFNLVGTGDLDNLIKRTLSIPVLCEVHTGPRVPGDTVQSFDTEMVQLQGELFGDPDFCTLKIVAGSAFGLPSPGHTTLTQLPSGDWNVDSFFDMTYRIEFEGCEKSKLEGLSGSTTGRIRMQTGNHPECEGSCAADEICVQTETVRSDGTIEMCCDCQPAPVCEPTDDGLDCEDTVCPSANERCVPQKVSCEGGTCRVIECKCQDPDVCHIELVQQQGTTKVSCTGGCPPKRYCARLPIDTDNNGSKDGFECVCRGKPKAILVPAGPKGASRAFGIEHEDIGGAAGIPSEEVVKEAIRVKLVQLYDEGVCPPRMTQPNLSLFDGEYRWFGPPAAFADNSLFAPKFVASELRCNATFRDWSEAAVSLDFPGANASVVHGYGAAVVPCSTFEVQIVEEYCADLSDESCYSEAVQFTTGLWGDLWAEFGLINFTDIGKEVDAFKGIPYDEGPPEDGAPPEVRAMLRGNVPPYSSRINFTDIGKVVNAFKTIAYGEFGPGEEICDDGIDNDCDGTIDADGSTCVGCGAGANCECSAGSCEDP